MPKQRSKEGKPRRGEEADMGRRFVVDLEGGCEETKLPNPTVKQHKIKAEGRNVKVAAQAAGILWLNANQGATQVEVIVEDA